MRESPPEAITQREGQHDADGGDRHGGGTHLCHRLEIGLQADLEQEENNAQFGQEPDQIGSRVGSSRDNLQQAGPEQHPGKQFAQHGGQAQPLGTLAEKLARHQHSGDYQQYVREAARSGGGPQGRRAQQGQQQQMPRARPKGAAPAHSGSSAVGVKMNVWVKSGTTTFSLYWVVMVILRGFPEREI
jgi:hypothetical protein